MRGAPGGQRLEPVVLDRQAVAEGGVGRDVAVLVPLDETDRAQRVEQLGSLYRAAVQQGGDLRWTTDDLTYGLEESQIRQGDDAVLPEATAAGEAGRFPARCQEVVELGKKTVIHSAGTIAGRRAIVKVETDRLFAWHIPCTVMHRGFVATSPFKEM